jgi:hypothetical protein
MSMRDRVFENLAEIYESWAAASTETLVDNRTDLSWADNPRAFMSLQEAIEECGVHRREVRQVFADVILGVLNSVVTALDAETDDGIDIAGEGLALRGSLSESLIQYLSLTGRLRLDERASPRRLDARNSGPTRRRGEIGCRNTDF